MFRPGVVALLEPAARELFPAPPCPSAIERLVARPLDRHQSSYGGFAVLVAIALLMALISTSFTATPRTAYAARPPGIAGSPTRTRRRNTRDRASRSRSAGFGSAVFQARDIVDMPQPGELRRRASASRCGTCLGLALRPRRPADRLSTIRINALQFLTIRATSR